MPTATDLRTTALRLTAAASIVLSVIPAIAQPAGGGRRGIGGGQRQLDQTSAESAWRDQARYVAQDLLGLGEGPTKSIADLYVKTRTEHAEALQEITDEVREAARSGDRSAVQGIREKLTETTAEYRDKLKQRLSIFTSGDNGKESLDTLSTFNGAWDQMTKALTDLGLDEESLKGAMDATAKYARDTAELAGLIGPNADREALGQKLTEARESLTEALEKVLSEDQVNAITRFARGAGGFGRGRRERP